MSDHASLAMPTVRVVRLPQLASPAYQTSSCLQARAPDALTTVISALQLQLALFVMQDSSVVLSTMFRPVTLNVLNHSSLKYELLPQQQQLILNHYYALPAH